MTKPTFAPTPVAPALGGALDAAAPTFAWTAIPGAHGYQLQVAATPGFESPILDVDAGNVTEITLPDTLSPTDEPRFWRVGAVRTGRDTSWSKPVPFRLPTLDALAAARDEEAAAKRAEAASKREAAHAQRGRTVVPPPPIAPDLAPLPTGESLSGGPASGAWSSVPGTAEHAPETAAVAERPRLLGPLGGAIVDGAAAPFAWTVLKDAQSYEVEVAPTADFSGRTLRVNAGATAELVLSGVLPTTGDRLFWRVRGLFPKGPGVWSKYGRFYAGTLDHAESFRDRQESERSYARRLAEHEALRREADLDLVAPCDRPDATTDSASSALILTMLALGIVMVVLAAVGGMVTP
ncbi:MAG TPA: hypothetical protein EYQ24_14565 [Bacteroidetes bacterium]|nr:hypothetical protein [Bacteroidota bacterium]